MSKKAEKKFKAKAKVKAKAIVKHEVVKAIKKNKVEAKAKAKSSIMLNTPTTKEQQAGLPKVINGDFDGVKRIDHLPFKDQLDMVFNPLHTITRTTVSDAVSESTFIVSPTPKTEG